jgi:lipopolysaccharide/colanic/teichoic acid biosynthesis glycosyltransferase
MRDRGCVSERTGQGPAELLVARTGATWYRHGPGKRLFDLAAAAVLLLVATPLLVVLVVLVRLDSPGPAIFRQERVGLRGRRFTIYKLRSLRAGADDGVHRAHISRLIHSSEVPLLADDPRQTRLGRWLRRTGLDELPQLLNVLSGSMSLVGPRPCLPYELELYEPWQRERLKVRPGLTGYWQVHGRGRVAHDDMVAMDVAYARSHCLTGDLAILLSTPRAALSRHLPVVPARHRRPATR